ncbi:hypothetical protein IG631_02544 [Alternaria alternata]|nr:hypothetical protein IG631_02544 [Alternaria alternata]
MYLFWIPRALTYVSIILLRFRFNPPQADSYSRTKGGRWEDCDGKMTEGHESTDLVPKVFMSATGSLSQDISLLFYRGVMA